MRANWRLGKWRDIPIALHWTVLLGLPWFLYKTGSVTAALVAFAAFLFLLMAHELGHAAVAGWRRVEVAHIQLFLLHGVCAHEVPDYEEDDVLIAWGGVAAQFVVLVIALGVDFLLPTLSPVAYFWAAPALSVLIDTNLLIMILNLIPVAPLDGAKAWRALPLLREWARDTSWAARVSELLSARKRARDRRLEAESQRIAAHIIDKLKKGKSDTPHKE
jgi:Zn-dependent protease